MTTLRLFSADLEHEEAEKTPASSAKLTRAARHSAQKGNMTKTSLRASAKQAKMKKPAPKTKEPRPWFRASTNSWYVQLGKKQIRLTEGRENEALAWEEFNKLKAQTTTSHKVNPRLDELAEDYLAWFSERRAAGTIHVAKVQLANFLSHYGDLTCEQFAERAFDLMEAWLAAAKKKWKAPDTRRLAIARVIALFNYGVRHRRFAFNPISGYEKPLYEPRQEIFTSEQEEAVYSVAKPDFRDLFFALIRTGGRTWEEVGKVECSQVVWSGKPGDSEPVAWFLGKVKRKDRYIHLDPDMIALTAKLYEKAGGKGRLFKCKKRDWTKANIGSHWIKIRSLLKKTRPELGLTDAHKLYCCRHTFIVRALRIGTIAEVAELAGNTIAVIERHYKKHCKQNPRLKSLVAAVASVANDVG